MPLSPPGVAVMNVGVAGMVTTITVLVGEACANCVHVGSGSFGSGARVPNKREISVSLRVGTGVKLGGMVFVGVNVLVDVAVAVGVIVGNGVNVSVGVGDGVRVLVDDAVAVGVLVKIGVGDGSSVLV